MTTPAGYTDLGLVGFTDRGSYNASATYVKNDLVNYKNIIWKCIEDDTIGIEPSSTATSNWVSWLRGQVDTGTGPITTTEWSTTLSDNNWKQISDASRLGKAPELWSVGDAVYTPIIASAHMSWIMMSRIAGFNHDNLAYEDGKAGITFVSNFTVTPALSMGVTQTNGGYLASNIANELKIIEGYLTQGLRDVLKSVKKKSLKKSADTVPEEFITKLFLPASVEMYSSASLSYISPNFKTEGSTYALFNTTGNADATGITKAAYSAADYIPGTTARQTYFLRTPGTSDTSYGCVDAYGNSSYAQYNTAYYYKFMFCV